MFNRVSNVILEAIAPPLPLKDDFCWHWNKVTTFYVDKDNRTAKNAVEQTSLPNHLHAMVCLLLQEEEQHGEQTDEYSLGPCFEFFFESKVLNKLTTLAQSDVPPGICQQLVASPYEESEVEFLNCIAVRIRDNENLLTCYTREKFPLITALTSLLMSADNDVSTKAGDALLCLLSVCKENEAEIIVNETTFCTKVIERLIELYLSIPKSLTPEEVESSTTATLLSDYNVNISAFSSAARKYLCFFRWFVFCDMVANETNCQLLTDAFLIQFKEQFLRLIASDLCENNIQTATFTTVLISNCLRNVGNLLTANIGEYFCSQGSENIASLLTVLIERCSVLVEGSSLQEADDNRRERHNLCISTMQLFEEILSKPSEKILNDLVIRFVASRGYYSVEANVSELLRSEDFDSLVFAEKSGGASPGSSPTNNFFSPNSHIHRILQFFMRLVPDELKSAENESEPGYESYISEAQKHFNDCVAVCENWSWKKNENCGESGAEVVNTSEDETTSAESQPEADRFDRFYEGDFLSMLFTNLENMVHLPYDVNLQVTSLLSKLALFPERHLNEYLLDPTIPLTKNSRSLFTVLHKVVDELQVKVQGVGNLQLKLRLTRNLLLGNNEDISVKTIDESNSKTLEALIVIEEFCKELAALAFVKYHNSL
ncbi:hypothetical protein B4U79_11350 [Dinothrombium tinctorium]|uniref:FHF complex subunit HOOK-interacting protein C-terminal domain-containing protein n=1 Tax=Dinothrombium tinctorium TaxID=1965070 RepID=A0A443R1T0_9ACAR|nr:hypothetical protein B4U79_11350 [Dinothrombium tinctorium]